MKQFDYNKVKDPEFFRDNRLDAHSDHVCYVNEEEEKRGVSSFRPAATVFFSVVNAGKEKEYADFF